MTPAIFFLILGVALIGTELLIMQLSLFWFLFFGVGALFASIVAWALPEVGWYISSGVFLLSSLATAAVLYPMLKKWQNQPSPISGNDAIGQRVTVLEPITPEREGKVMWSGSDWPARLASGNEGLAEGESAIIKRLEGIRLIVGR